MGDLIESMHSNPGGQTSFSSPGSSFVPNCQKILVFRYFFPDSEERMIFLLRFFKLSLLFVIAPPNSIFGHVLCQSGIIFKHLIQFRSLFGALAPPSLVVAKPLTHGYRP